MSSSSDDLLLWSESQQFWWINEQIPEIYGDAFKTVAFVMSQLHGRIKWAKMIENQCGDDDDDDDHFWCIMVLTSILIDAMMFM